MHLQLYRPENVETEFSDVDRSLLLALIDKERLTPYIHPIYDLYTGSLFGYELLIRTLDVQIPPSILFEKARHLGLSWELETACRKAALAKITELDREGENLFYFINVSPDIFSHPMFTTGFTMRTLHEMGLDHNRIVLEITETVSAGDYVRFEEIIRYYIEQGFHIALDDFGSGHSGLMTLVASTPHFMKIDRKLIEGIHRNSYKQNLVRMFGVFASNVGSNVLAEGVETVDELRTAFRLGARYVQGFIFGKPTEDPQTLDPEIREVMNDLLGEYNRRSFSVDLGIHKLVVRPDTFPTTTVTCGELDTIFRMSPGMEHVVVVDEEDKPVGLLTQHRFKSVLGGRYGFAVFQKKYIDGIVGPEMLVANEHTDLRILSKLAMARDQHTIYDPVVIVDDQGRLVGTITMKQLISKAFDMEIKVATSANPLTQLPGNVVINVWLEEVLLKPPYSVIYIDLDNFKEYNDAYGFSAGDDMIKLLADVLSDKIQEMESTTRLGHIGGDDFIIICEDLVTPGVLQNLCETFDSRKEVLFSAEDLSNGYYLAVDRKGRRDKVNLVTLSLSVISSMNFDRPPHPGQLGQAVAHLKKKVKSINKKTGTSGYLIDKRKYEV